MTGQVPARCARNSSEAHSIQCMFSTMRTSGGRARAEEHLAKRVEGPLLELGAGQAVEEFRRGDAEEVGEQDTGSSPSRPRMVLFGDPIPDLVAGDSLGETE